MSYIPLQKGIVYGPVASKRLGRSFGINLMPHGKKVCTFNCVYCFYGKTPSAEARDFPTASEVLSAVEEKLKDVGEIDYITFAGNGEPTLHPEFDEIVKKARELRDRMRPSIPLALLSNSSRIMNEKVSQALKMFELPILKLDAGDEETFHKINRPLVPIRLKEIIEGLRRLKNPVIQTVAVCGKITNTDEEQVEKWLKALKRIDPKQVQLYTLDNPLPESEITPCSIEKLSSISLRTQRFSLPLTIYK
jgi:wyosine [tRNA(Phe)-imidazoG37] synthetase (radical SAM superfamily)